MRTCEVLLAVRYGSSENVKRAHDRQLNVSAASSEARRQLRLCIYLSLHKEKLLAMSPEEKGWTKVSDQKLGQGGNGKVYLYERDGVRAALKFLIVSPKPGSDRLPRFLDEIRAMEKCQDIPGVLQLLDHSIPDNASRKNPPWFCAELATPLLTEMGESPSLKRVVAACSGYAEVLRQMHDRGFSHRDIKPGNLFFKDDRWMVGDFGLVDYPGKDDITSDERKLGPANYIAPEMLLRPHISEGSPADVYSLAKVLWKLATNSINPFPGEYPIDDPEYRLETCTEHMRAYLLDRLIEVSCVTDPTKRPTMADFSQELATWSNPPQPSEGESRSLDLSKYTKKFQALSGQDRERQAETHRQRRLDADEKIRGLLQRFTPIVNEMSKALSAQSPANSVSTHLDNGGIVRIPYAIDPDFASRPEMPCLYQNIFEISLTPSIGQSRFELVGGSCLFYHDHKHEFGNAPAIDEPPRLNWSTVMYRKRRTENGKQAAQAGRDCSEASAG